MKRMVARKKKGVGTWELINPEGVVSVEPMSLNRHPGKLDGKRILLRWNGKHNGDLFLNRIAERLADQIKGAQIIKAWEVSPETVVAISGSQEQSVSLANRCAALKPDIVIGAYGD
jgi:hypothetical protein